MERYLGVPLFITIILPTFGDFLFKSKRLNLAGYFPVEDHNRQMGYIGLGDFIIITLESSNSFNFKKVKIWKVLAIYIYIYITR